MQQIIVYTNSRCPICSKRAAYYQRFDKKEMILWQDVSENREGLDEEVTNYRIGQVLHVRDSRGTMRRGIRAYNTLWLALAGRWWLPGFLTSQYSLKWIPILAYAVIWRVRWHLGHKKFH